MTTRIVDRYAERPPLDRDSIVRAARAIVVDDGLAELTMRRLGRELGVEAMSIYHHVPNKAALLRLLASEALAPLDDFSTAEPASATLADFARALRSVILANADLTPLIVEDDRLVGGPAAHRVVAQLQRTGFDASASTWIVESFVGFVVGHSIVSIEAGTSFDDAAFETGLRFMLAGLRDELGEEQARD